MGIANEINEAQNTDEMLKRLLEMSIKLYTDGAHFIYELIQNADDTEARIIKFIQHENYLEVLHNGIPFTKSNLQRICDACNSDKSGDDNKIGEFGIGFKSVFAICERVKIYSDPSHYKEYAAEKFPEFAVEIIDFRKAEDIEHQPMESEFTTRFIFPYKIGLSFTRFSSMSELNMAISSRLKDLGIASMLFLRHIEKISYKIVANNEEDTFELEPIKINDHCCLISPKSKNKEISYLKFSRSIEQSPNRTVDIAFPVTITEDGQYEFQKSSSPFISVFFPTQTESKLNFLVQAPYQLTPDRSNVSADRSTKEGKINRDLARQTTDLLIDSIIELRNEKHLNLSFWRIMPLSKSIFYGYDLFNPFYDAIVQLAKTQDVIPCRNGNYANANHVKLVRGQWLTDLFPDNLLSELINKGIEYFWLSEKITKDGDPKLFEFFHGSNGLKIEQIEPESFGSLFNGNPTFLENRSNDWLIKLYNAYGNEREALFNKTSSSNLLTTIFIKTSKGNFIAPYRKDRKNNYIPNIYLPSSIIGLNLEYVDEEIYKKCKHFFENILQITKPDEYGCFKAELKARYDAGYHVSEQEHISDIKYILKYLNSSDKSEDIRRFLNEHFLLRCKKDGKIVYWNSLTKECYFEKSKSNLDIKTYYENLYDKYFVDSNFYENNGITYDDLLKLGVNEEIGIVELNAFSYIAKNPNKNDSLVKSSIIFKILKQDLGYFGNFYNYQELISKVLEGGYKWLYSDKMQIVGSKEISKFELNPDIYGNIDFNSNFYVALQFKITELDRREAFIKEYATLSPEKKEVYLRQAVEDRFGMSLEDLANKITISQEEKRFEFPEESVKNLTLLKSHINEMFCFAAPVKYEYVTRHIRTSSRPTDTRTYLKRMYRDNNTATYACQLCHGGFNDLEMCQIEPKPKFELAPLHVCLCPTCAAKFKRIKSDEKAYAQFFNPLEFMSHESLTHGREKLKFFGNELWFTQVHLAEIIECLSLMAETQQLKIKTLKSSVGKKIKHIRDGLGTIESCIKRDDRHDFDITILYESTKKTYSLNMCIENDWLELVD